MTRVINPFRITAELRKKFCISLALSERATIISRECGRRVKLCNVSRKQRTLGNWWMNIALCEPGEPNSTIVCPKGKKAIDMGKVHAAVPYDIVGSPRVNQRMQGLIGAWNAKRRGKSTGRYLSVIKSIAIKGDHRSKIICYFRRIPSAGVLMSVVRSARENAPGGTRRGWGRGGPRQERARRNEWEEEGS